MNREHNETHKNKYQNKIDLQAKAIWIRKKIKYIVFFAESKGVRLPFHLLLSSIFALQGKSVGRQIFGMLHEARLGVFECIFELKRRSMPNMGAPV